jgi:hypothetical protein
MSINNNAKDNSEVKKTSSATSQITEPTTSPSAVLHSLPGLEPLDQTDKLYIVKRNEPFPYNLGLGLPTRSYFQIYDSEGRHIFSACQTDPPFRERKFVMYIYNANAPIVGEPILKILQRCPERPEEVDKAEILPFKKLDEELTQLNTLRKSSHLGKRRSYKEARGHIHLRHLDHDFVGHIWRGKTEFRVFNANLQHLFTFPKELSSLHSEGQKRKKVGLFNNKWAFYDYFLSGKSEPLLPHMPLGRVQWNADVGCAGIFAERKNCSMASFPFEFSSVEKCLILTFALSMYCRTKSTSEALHQRCLFFILGVSTLVVLLILILGTVCELASNSRCRVFEA